MSGLPYAIWHRDNAVTAIRYAVYQRSGHRCEGILADDTRCNRPLEWSTFHMHEKVPRGDGGEISLANSVALCPPPESCHARAHANRKPQWSKRS